MKNWFSKAAQLLRNSDPKANDDFSILEGNRDGHRIVVMANKAARNSEVKSSLPWFLTISTRLINPTEDGLTTNEEATELNAWEGQLERVIKAERRFFYVGRTTCSGSRELLYYVDAPGNLSETLKKLNEGTTTRSFTCSLEKDDKWEKVSAYLR
jgi:hypothetical protein